MGRPVKSGLIQLILMAIWMAVAPPLHAQDLRFGVTPVLGEAETRAEFEPLMTYLSIAVGLTIDLYIAKDSGDLLTQMEAGTVDLGSFSPVVYVAAARGGKIRIIAQSILGGSTSYRGIVIKRFDSGINSLGDLEGKRFAFVDRESASGYVFPWAMLIEKGIDPARYFKETIFAGTHEQVIAAVLLGWAHAGATNDAAVAGAKAKGVPTFDLEVLATIEPIPHDAIVVRAGLEEALVKKVQTSLVDVGQSSAGRQMIARSQKKLTGYAPADDSSYDVVRRATGKGGM